MLEPVLLKEGQETLEAIISHRPILTRGALRLKILQFLGLTMRVL